MSNVASGMPAVTTVYANATFGDPPSRGIPQISTCAFGAVWSGTNLPAKIQLPRRVPSPPEPPLARGVVVAEEIGAVDGVGDALGDGDPAGVPEVRADSEVEGGVRTLVAPRSREIPIAVTTTTSARAAPAMGVHPTRRPWDGRIGGR